MNQVIRQLLFATCAAVGTAAPCVAASDSALPVVELLGEKYHVYKAVKGDSLFGIARNFGWDYNKLCKLNPNAVGALKKDMLVYYPVATSGQTSAQVEAQAKPETAADSQITHLVKRGENVYAIAKMYGVSVERIYSLNPSSRNGVKAGETLVIREAGKANNANNSTQTIFYSVKKGDTLYALSKEYGVTVAAIMECNPGLDESNFQADSTIKIPKKGTGVNTELQTVEQTSLDAVKMHKVSKNDSWTSIASGQGISEDVLHEANPNVSKLKNNDYIAIPQVEVTTTQQEVVTEDPREQSNHGLSEIYHEVHGIEPGIPADEYTVRIAIVADAPSSKKDKEFIRGFLTGVDKLKRSNGKIVMKVINGAASNTSVTADLDEFMPSLVFSTSESDLPEYLTEYASSKRTPVVNTFDVKSNAYADNPYIIQLLTPPSLFNDNIAAYMHEHYGDRILVFVGEEDANDQLAESLYAVWDLGKTKNIASVDALIPEMFSSDGRYLFYSYDTKRQDVAKFLQNVADVKENLPLADIISMGRPNLILFEDNMSDAFKKASLSLPSRFYIDKDSNAYRDFMQRYRLLFDKAPSKSLPLYAGVGYDTSVYFIEAMTGARGDLNNLTPSHNMVQSDFDLHRPSAWSGFLNPPVYLIDYTTWGAVNKNVITFSE